MFFLCSTVLAILHFSLLAEGAAVVCYNCATTSELSCGLTKQWTTSYLEAGAASCPENVCYTYVKIVVGEAPMVYRGCGQLVCDLLPEGRSQDLCENSSGVWKVKKLDGQLLNATRSFSSQPTAKIASTGVLAYCDSDRCNSGAIQFAKAEEVPKQEAPIVKPEAPIVKQEAPKQEVPASSIACYNCESVTGQVCGLTRGWTTSHLEPSARACPPGVCHTYIKTIAGQAPVVYRGCGLLDCDNLPRGYNTADVCENSSGVWKVKRVADGQLFNTSRTYSTQPPANEFASGTLQYCSGDRCNSGAVQVVNIEQKVNNALPPTSCIKCKSYVNEPCGLANVADTQVATEQCMAGYCYSYVWAEAGGMPLIMRGCGSVNCGLIPGVGSNPILCDDNAKLLPVNTAKGQMFNANRYFCQPFAPSQAYQTATVQYCNQGPNCNSGPVPEIQLRNGCQSM